MRQHPSVAEHISIARRTLRFVPSSSCFVNSRSMISTTSGELGSVLDPNRRPSFLTAERAAILAGDSDGDLADGDHRQRRFSAASSETRKGDFGKGMVGKGMVGKGMVGKGIESPVRPHSLAPHSFAHSLLLVGDSGKRQREGPIQGERPGEPCYVPKPSLFGEGSTRPIAHTACRANDANAAGG